VRKQKIPQKEVTKKIALLVEQGYLEDNISECN
jgi:hypothetical protein